jgi:hypothetical protein
MTFETEEDKSQSAPLYGHKIAAHLMKLIPYIFQFLSGGDGKVEADVATRQAPKIRRPSVRLFLIGVRSPNDQQHFVAIPRSVCTEADDSVQEFQP